MDKDILMLVNGLSGKFPPRKTLEGSELPALQ
jgi:hypothetical protein